MNGVAIVWLWSAGGRRDVAGTLGKAQEAAERHLGAGDVGVVEPVISRRNRVSGKPVYTPTGRGTTGIRADGHVTWSPLAFRAAAAGNAKNGQQRNTEPDD